MVRMKTLLYVLVFAAVAWAAAPTLADQTVLSDTMFVSNGTIGYYQAIGEEPGQEGVLVLLSGQYPLNLNMLGRPTIVYEGLPSTNPVIGDVFGIPTSGGMQLGFISDDLGPLDPTLIEQLFHAWIPGDPQNPSDPIYVYKPIFVYETMSGYGDLKDYLLSDAANPWTGEFWSAANGEIPEPVSLVVWSVLGAMGAGLGVWRKRKAA